MMRKQLIVAQCCALQKVEALVLSCPQLLRSFRRDRHRSWRSSTLVTDHKVLTQFRCLQHKTVIICGISLQDDDFYLKSSFQMLNSRGPVDKTSFHSILGCWYQAEEKELYRYITNANAILITLSIQHHFKTVKMSNTSYTYTNHFWKVFEL